MGWNRLRVSRAGIVAYCVSLVTQKFPVPPPQAGEHLLPVLEAPSLFICGKDLNFSP